MDKVSLFRSTIHFYVKNHHICIRTSTLSGFEIVTLNGQVVSRQRAWSKQSSHRFECDGVSYDVCIQADSRWCGPVHYILRCQAQPIRHKRVDLYRPGGFHPAVRHLFRGLIYIVSVSLLIAITLVIFNQIDWWGLAFPMFFITLLVEHWVDKKFARASSGKKYPCVDTVATGTDEPH